jgi:hypothetical protein
VQETHRDIEPPLHPPGVGLHEPVGRVCQAKALERCGHPLLEVAAGDPVELALEHQVLASRRLRVGTVSLADDADRVAHRSRVCQHVDARHPRGAAVGRRERGQDPDRRRLAGSVGTQQPEDRPRLHREADAVECRYLGRIGLFQVRRLHRHGLLL